MKNLLKSMARVATIVAIVAGFVNLLFIFGEGQLAPLGYVLCVVNVTLFAIVVKWALALKRR